MALTMKQSILLLIAFLTFGSMNTILTKIQFTMSSVGSDGELKLFKMPWFQTFNMMLAMFYVLAHRCFGRKSARQLTVEHINCEGGLMNNDATQASQGPSFGKKVLMISAPAFFDIVATALGAAGMLYIPASLWQMLRGSSLVFAALMSIIFLGHKMQGFHWLGLSLCVVGVSTVGIANVLDTASKGGGDEPGDKSSSDLLLGIFLVIIGQVVQAGQVIAEEFIMKECDLAPFDIIGFEGMWGVLQMIIVVYPIVWITGIEDPVDTLTMVGNSGGLLAVVFAFQFSCATFNMTGIVITSQLSAVHRMMLDASRTMVVWGFGLMVHHINAECSFGEVWTKYSKVQFLGFCILLTGQATYGKVLKWKCLEYPQDAIGAASPAALTFSPQANPAMQSPATLKMGANMIAVDGPNKTRK